jgi:UDP-glucose 4-epimerase
MSILVLGGNGFIGSHVVDALCAGGHDVRVFDRSLDPWRAPLAGVRYYLGNFDDRPLLAEALQGVDVVVHLISTTVPSTSNLDPVADIESNLVRSVRLLELMRGAGIKRIIFFSSGGTVYGVPDAIPIREDQALNPICSYGVVKVATEKYLLMFERLYGLRPLILRPSNPYGPRQGHVGVQGVVATFMNKVISGEMISIWGDGSVKRDYIEVTDLARLCRLGVESGATGVFNVGSGVGLSVNELVTVVERTTSIKAMTEYLPARQFDVPEIVLDVAKAQEVFGWRAEISFEEGMQRYLRWLHSLKKSATGS